MLAIGYILNFILGAIIGSFLNVVALRYNTGKSVAGRSGCFTCGGSLRWYELIPIVSFFMQKGRCRTCYTRIAWQYPIVETVTGLIFALILPPLTFFTLSLVGADISVSSAELISAFFVLIIFCLLIIITVYDFRHKIIPDGLVYAFIILSFAGLFVHFADPLSLRIPSEFELYAGPMLFVPFFLLWLISRGRWIGLGDGKLVLGMGWFLGLSASISAVILAFWMGAVWSIFALYFSRKHLTMKSELPFAPFLILGFTIAYFFQPDILHLNDLLGI